jgi:phosphoglucomutase/phosphopentomutase
MSQKEGFNFIETLTGFKWMGNKSYELLKQGKKVIFAYEEAIGYCCGTAVLDKDGISAAFQVATLTSFLHFQKKTLSEKLEEIYNEYGYHVSRNSYFICHDGEKIKRIFERIRNISGPNTVGSKISKCTYVSLVCFFSIRLGFWVLNIKSIQYET